MSRIHMSRRHLLRLGAATAAAVAVTAPSTAWARGATTDTVKSWIDQNATGIRRLDPSGGLDDLKPLRRMVGRAQVVGIGESTHGTHEEFTLRHRAVRFLVERMGFRTIAWEDNWAAGVAIDRYIAGGPGNPRELVTDMSSIWRSEAMIDLVQWLRGVNDVRADHDKVRFVGTDLVQLRQLGFDDLREYVTRVAPEQVEELTAHLEPISMHGNGDAHVGWFLGLSDAEKETMVDHALAVYDLIMSLPQEDGEDREYARQHARAILGFYEYYSVGELDVRETFIADTLIRWQRLRGHRAVYWASNAHVAASPEVTVSLPPWRPPTRAVGAGGHLREEYGEEYMTIATMFHSGRILQGWETGEPSVFDVPPASPHMANHLFDQARKSVYLLDLHSRAGGQVRRWLDAEVTLRLIGSAYDAQNDADYAMSVDSFITAFDAIFHIGRVSPAKLP